MHKVWTVIFCCTFFGGCQLFLNLSTDQLIENTPIRCFDGVDNDGDGQTDCGDLECSIFCLECGNGVLDPNEECDDANLDEQDSCKNNCTLNTCENGIVEPAEFCPRSFTVFPIEGFPTASLLQDLDQDGFPDLVVLFSKTTKINVFWGDGDGGFSSVRARSTGKNPSSMTSGDFNQDGFPDIAVANIGTSDVSVFLGNPNRDVALQVQDTFRFPAGEKPVFLLSADFSGDGLLDLLCAQRGNNTLSILRGEGDGTFQNFETIPLEENPSSLSTGDFNQDGFADLAAANAGANSVRIFLGNNTSSNAQDALLLIDTFLIEGTAEPSSVVTADFDQDGFPDLAVANLHPNTLELFSGTGDGKFDPIHSFSTDGKVTFLAPAALDADQTPDLLFFEIRQNSLRALRSAEKTLFHPLDEIENTLIVKGSLSSVNTDDLNGDNAGDLVTIFVGPNAFAEIILASP